MAPDRSEPWRTAHDALARHGRARIGKAEEPALILLWQDYCIALDDACSTTHSGSYPQLPEGGPT